MCGDRLGRGRGFFEPSSTRSAKGPGGELRGPSHQVADTAISDAYAVTPAPVRGSSTTIAVFPERSAAQPSYWSLNSAHRAQSRSRSSPSAARPRTARGPSGNSTTVSGLRLQVQPPRGVGLGPAVHRQRDQVRAVLVVPDDRDSWLTRAAPNRRQAQQPERVARSPQPDPSPAEPKECAVQQPGDADDHSRRDTEPAAPRWRSRCTRRRRDGDR